MTTIVHLTDLSNRWMKVPCSCFDGGFAPMPNCIWCAGDGTLDMIEDRAELILHEDDAEELGSLLDIDFRSTGTLAVDALRDLVETALLDHDESPINGLLCDAHALTTHTGIVPATLVRWRVEVAGR